VPHWKKAESPLYRFFPLAEQAGVAPEQSLIFRKYLGLRTLRRITFNPHTMNKEATTPND
jgi:hypothetical protein